MELRHLRYFKTVAEELNFSRAAEKLRVAQPALSRQIRALEEELGAPLLTRARGVQLTDGGRVFYAHTCKVLAQVDIAVASFREAATGHAGELVICNDWRLSGQFLPEVVAEFHAAFPRAEVALEDLRFHDQVAALRSRRAHVGFVVRSLLGRDRELENMLILRTRLVVVLPARHPRASDRELRLSDLADEKWLLLDEKSAPGYRTFLVQLCRLAGFVPQVGKTAATPEGLVGRVASGYGIALVMENTTGQPHALTRLVPVDVDPLEICAVWHRRESSPLLHAFLEIVRQHASRNATLKPKATVPQRPLRVTAVPRRSAREHRDESPAPHRSA